MTGISFEMAGIDERGMAVLSGPPSKTRGTVQYFMATRWNAMNARTVNGTSPRWECKGASIYLRKGIRLEMTKEEFYGWCLSNWHYAIKLQKQNLIPSIDRIDSNKHYSLDNIQIISRNDNSCEFEKIVKRIYSLARRIKATNVKTGKVTIGIRSELRDKLGLKEHGICVVVSGFAKTHYGYKLEYIDKHKGLATERVYKTKYDHEEVVRLKKNGVRNRDIAKKIGCHPNYVVWIIRNKMQ